VMVQHIGAEAGKCLGVRRIFARILPNLPLKISINSKIKLFILCWAPLRAIVANIFRGLFRFSGIL